MTYKWLVHGILLATLAGCEPSSISLPTSKNPDAIAVNDQFEASRCGVLEGSVRWNDDVPAIPPVQRPISLMKHEAIANPNSLQLDTNKNVIGALVMLRGVDPRKSKPWPHPPAEVELHERGITVHQGDSHGRYGIVRRGESVVIRSSGEKALGVRGRGAGFSHILPQNHNRMERVFSNEGRVELTSASGQFWASADLIVSDHPYVTLTDTAGNYRFEQVPAGTYDLAVYHPIWLVATTEIDPESGLPVRQQYKPPFEITGRITLEPQAKAVLHFSLNLTD